MAKTQGSVAKFEISLRLGMLQEMTQIAKQQQSWIQGQPVRARHHSLGCALLDRMFMQRPYESVIDVALLSGLIALLAGPVARRQ